MDNPVRTDARLGTLRLARSIVGSAVFPAIAFVGAGRLDWPRGWVYGVLFVAVAVAGMHDRRSR